MGYDIVHPRRNAELDVLAGEDKVIELITDKLWELKTVGMSFIIIGHTKSRNVDDPITGESYMQLTTNLAQRYFNAMKNKVHLLGVAAIDRTIIKEKTGKKNPVTKKDETRGIVTSQARKISFRDDNYVIDSKSRFRYIVDSIPLDADELIKAITDAIIAARGDTPETFAEAQRAESESAKAVAERVAADEDERKRRLAADEKVNLIIEYCKEHKTDTDVIKAVMARCKELGYDNPQKITDLADAEAVLEICK